MNAVLDILTANDLSQLFNPEKNYRKLEELGGVSQIAAKVRSDLSNGLFSADENRRLYGTNVPKKETPPSIFHFLWEAYNDRTLVMLTVAALMSLAISVYRHSFKGTGWIEGTAILAAIIIVVLVNAVNDFQKDRQFRELSQQNEERSVRAVRSGIRQIISIYDVTVGDILELEPGDILPADALYISGFNVRADESSVTGEVESVKKGPDDPFYVSGTKILAGTGTALVVAVGIHSFRGHIMEAISQSAFSDSTPLQQKLDSLAETIAMAGSVAAISMFVLLLAKYIIVTWPPQLSAMVEHVLNILVQTITIVVVAVPEGLPMAVTLTLAFATTRMLKDSNLVRVLSACETMGTATCICSDKTGTLTENRMTVVRGKIAGLAFDEHLPENIQALMAEAVAINSTAFKTDSDSYVGSKTEAALLHYMEKRLPNTRPFEELRAAVKIKERVPFSSDTKTMTTTTESRLHCKGAAEVVLGQCCTQLDAQMQKIPIDVKQSALYIEELANSGLRTLALAFSSSKEDPLCLLAVLGIEDPLRQGVTEAVHACQKAGIFVRMVTGDNLHTAISIALKCGILMRGGIAMEGRRFRALSEAALNETVPRLQVLARSTPLDKQILVRWLRSHGQVVAATGDGTNDGPALKSANVGFAMGIAGTEVAKSAASIVLLDDNFASIVKAVRWGRCVNDSVRKFIQFQLTVNISAVAIAFVSALLDQENRAALTAVQLLWINLIMDTLAALALATDKPAPDILERHPEFPDAPLITFNMWRMIIGQALFQFALSMLLLYVLRQDPALRTVVFNTFVFTQLMNEINCRVLDKKLNVFPRLFSNPIFASVWISTSTIQIAIVQYGHSAFGTIPLSLLQWTMCLFAASISFLVALIIKLLPDMFKPPQSEPVFISKERLQWQAAITNVQSRLRVFTALRRARRPIRLPTPENIN